VKPLRFTQAQHALLRELAHYGETNVYVLSRALDKSKSYDAHMRRRLELLAARGLVVAREYQTASGMTRRAWSLSRAGRDFIKT
jgi:predicted ArsR family transcriptional regulator